MSDSPQGPFRSLMPALVIAVLVPTGLYLGKLAADLPVQAKPKADFAASLGVPEDAEALAARRARIAAARAENAEHAVAPVTTTEAAPESQAEKPKSAHIVSQWSTLQNALAESDANGKPVMLDFNAAWCGPCQRLKEEVFEDGGRGTLVQAAVIPVSIVDRAQEDGQNPPDIAALQQRFGVDAFPTLVIFQPATGRIEKHRGYGDPDQMLDWIEKTAASMR